MNGIRDTAVAMRAMKLYVVVYEAFIVASLKAAAWIILGFLQIIIIIRMKIV